MIRLKSCSQNITYDKWGAMGEFENKVAVITGGASGIERNFSMVTSPFYLSKLFMPYFKAR
ncbi:MAG: hypothetical protein K2J39_09955 [Ruminococcus sp.]|nr:hypothetical protein [Ruminococcus sp.]